MGLLASLHMFTQIKFIKILAASLNLYYPLNLILFFCIRHYQVNIFFPVLHYSGFNCHTLFKIKAKADPIVTRSSNTTYFLILLLVLRIAGFPPRPLFFIKLRILLYLFLAK